MSREEETQRARKRGRWDTQGSTPVSDTNGTNDPAVAALPPAANGAQGPGQVALRTQAAMANLGDIKARLAALKAQRAAKAAGQTGQTGTQPTAAVASQPSASAEPTTSAAKASDAGKPFRAAPLRLDAEGREVDETGKVIERTIETTTSLKINQKRTLPPEPEPEPEIDPESFVDPEMHVSRGGDRRRRSNFTFVQEGKLQKAAEIGRLRAEYGDGAVIAMRKREDDERRAAKQQTGDPNLIPLGTPQVEAEPEQQPKEDIPDIEWWDARICEEGATYDSLAVGPAQTYAVQPQADSAGVSNKPILLPPLPAAFLRGKVTNLVQHPVPILPPAEAAPPPPRPLMLTKKETRKIRKQRREEKEKEKQDLIRQGLLEPPPPKVKISNLMRVLGEEAVMDPTAIEQQVRDQMAERQQAHDDRNLARKLTPQERREKKLNKLVGDVAPETLVSVYRVESLAKPQHRYKVDINAVENHLTGSAVITDSFCAVIVEGTAKSLKRYGKLMTRRIDWAAVDEDDEAPNQGQADGALKPPNSCVLVWEGSVQQAAFQKFSVEVCLSEKAARKLLADRGVGHYWDLALQASPL